MVYAHQHYINRSMHTPVCSAKKCADRPTFTEKCQICDSMHHVNMEMANQPAYYVITAGTPFVFKTFEYDFTSIALILTPGRAPPVVS
jgi:hypothetical protein